ncbi:MAG: hypothetical protein AABW88_00235 [Nanoarchaeota archaeon]
MTKEEEYKLWKEHIESQFLYRIVSEEYLPNIKKHGFNPDKNPFRKMKKEFNGLFVILLRLKKQGIIIKRNWGKIVDQEQVIRTTKKDLNKNYVDFTPNYKHIIQYYLGLRGGALVNTILIFTKEILKRKIKLNRKETKIVKKLNKWAMKKTNVKNKAIRIKASSKYLENAHFQVPGMKKYTHSPFGSFNHFKKILQKKRFDFYRPYLENKKLFYLRTRTKIPSTEII